MTSQNLQWDIETQVSKDMFSVNSVLKSHFCYMKELEKPVDSKGLLLSDTQDS